MAVVVGGKESRSRETYIECGVAKKIKWPPGGFSADYGTYE